MHTFINYKGFEHAAIDLFSPLTVLIGPNGSGKSNVIEGLELISFLARGRPLHEIMESGRGGTGLEVRGGVKGCARFGANSFILNFGATVKFGAQRKPILYSVAINVEGTPKIQNEKLQFLDDDVVVFETLTAGPGRTSDDVIVAYNNFAQGKYKPQESVSAQRSVLSQYSNFAGKNRRKPECDSMVEAIQKHLRASFVFDPRPSLMRAYEKIGDNVLRRNGSNLSSVLYGLTQTTSTVDVALNPIEKEAEGRKKATFERLQKWICAVPDEEFTGIGFVTTPLNDVIFGLKSPQSNRLVDASVLSDGTLRSLAFVAALETVEEGSRVVMEEFDNGVHPSRVGLLVTALAECSKRRNLKVLVTTHNPATLNSLEGPQLDGVVFSVWDKTKKSYSLITLKDLPRLPEFLEGGRLGDLVTRKIVEEYLAPNFDEEKKKTMQSWASKLP